ncbi:MAG TPA: GNAT family N-acetyltransferase [Jiangellaceae bacterium]|nr:GNAT family N-acetyltransferase [Jiangellaceae bacterium]
MATDVHVTNNPDQHRYEARIDGTVAGFVDYELTGNQIVLAHTEVDDNFEGRGVGSALARGALDDVRGRGLDTSITCPFLANWARNHQEYADLLDD